MYKIYKLIYEDKVVYVGQTTQKLSRRKHGDYGKNDEFFKLCDIELIEETNDISREIYWIEYYISIGQPLLNKRNGDNINGYKITHKDKIKEYLKEYMKKYRVLNKDKMLEYDRKYQQSDKRKQYLKEYRLKNKQKNNGIE